MVPTLTRLAVWTPLPPQSGSVAAENVGLLAALARRVDVVVVVDDWVVPLAAAPEGCELIGASDFVALGEPADLNLYHLADDFDGHAFVHTALLRTPGLVMLHDLSFYEFYRTASHREPERLRSELWRNHGAQHAERDPRRTVLLRRVLDASLGVVVDNPGAQAEIKRRFPAAHVEVIARPLPPRVPEADVRDVREDLGWTDDDLVVGTLDTLDAIRRPELSVVVAAACRAVDDRVQLLVAGRARDPATVDRLETRLGAFDPGVAALVTDPGPAVFDACVDACDVLLDLRVETTGSVPTTVRRGLASGVPVITSDLAQVRHLDDRCCWRVAVPAGSAVPQATGRILQFLDPGFDRSATRTAAWQATADADIRTVAQRQLEAVHDTLGRRRPPPPRGAPPARPLNVYGDFTAVTGLMETGRRLTRALLDSPLDVRVVDITSYGPPHSESRAAPELASVSRERTLAGDHLWFANINEFERVTDDALRPPGADGRVIGFWFWELPKLPSSLVDHVHRVDEIWVASHFVRDTMRRYTNRPVHVVPIPIEPRLPTTFSRRDYDLPDDAVLYFFNFDVDSIVARKNPFGIITAFRRAFEPWKRGRDVRLVIKCTNLTKYPAFEAALCRSMDDIGGIVMRDDLGHAEMNALLASIDVYVSLHRSEGFGLGMAEAMALGKAVIGTAYSGSLEFLQPGVSCPVGYRVRPITELDHEWWPEGVALFPPSFAYWAEPDLEAAARWMRLLFERPVLRQRIGNAAALDIADRYSSARAQATVLDLLARPPRAAP